MGYQVLAHYHVVYSYETCSYTHYKDQPTFVRVMEGDKQITFVAFSSNKVTGARNETGLRRYARLLRKAKKQGIAVEIGRPMCINGYDNLEEFHKAINLEAY